jgi:hypothetical protein
MTAIAKNLTTHVALVLDRSISMQDLRHKTIQIADNLVSFLAEQSQKMGQEWRVTVYTFGDDVDCHIWDMDVLRLPSMKEHYRIKGNTALVDAVFLALDDGDKITEHRGDHSFLVYVITDGEENRSRLGSVDRWGYPSKEEKVRKLSERMRVMPPNRTLSVLVPNEKGVREAQDFGFPLGNVKLWDASSEQGMEEAAEAIKESATRYMEARATGVRSTTSLFVGENVDAKSIKDAKLIPLPTENRRFVLVTKSRSTESLFFEKPINRVTKKRLVPDVAWHVEIKDFVDAAYPPYRVGMAFYELIKAERVTADKRIAVVDNNTKQVYVGDGARRLLSLPNGDCRVKPTLNPGYKIFVESNSVNRHLRLGTEVLLLTK